MERREGRDRKGREREENEERVGEQSGRRGKKKESRQ